MTNQRKERNGQRESRPAFDLEERTACFGENVIAFARQARVDCITRPIVSQLVRSATSIGANYAEADDAESKKDFRHKVGLCRKEARETKHWFRMVVAAQPDLREKAVPLWQEAKELHLIFVAIVRKSRDAG